MKCKAYHVFFGSLANPLKIEIITYLKTKPASVTELVKKLKVEQSKLSHALASLKHCHVVEVKKDGKSRIYSLNKKTILPILEILDKHREHFCKGCEYKK